MAYMRRNHIPSSKMAYEDWAILLSESGVSVGIEEGEEKGEDMVLKYLPG